MNNQKFFLVTNKKDKIYFNRINCRKFGENYEFFILQDFLKLELYHEKSLDLEIILHTGNYLNSDYNNKTNFKVIAKISFKFDKEDVKILSNMECKKFNLKTSSVDKKGDWSANIRKLSEKFKKENNINSNYLLTHPFCIVDSIF